MKTRPRGRRSKSRIALVCAGGGVTGAVYEIGCLRALEDLLDRSVLDLDLYVGVSGGAFVASLLAQGVSPEEMYGEVMGGAGRGLGIGRAPLFRLGLAEFLKRSLQAPRVLKDALLTALRGDGGRLADFGFGLLEMLPPGLLDNSGIQEFLETLFRSRGGTDRFEDLVRKLYIVAVDLDTAAHVAFGERGYRDVPISKAVQASTALPGLYRPVRIGDRDFVDGGVKKTAHINLAIRHGADLVICVNPLVPILNHAEAGHLSNKGVASVLEQVLRIMVYGRMHYGLERYEIEHPEVDILLLEPRREDLEMFGYNIMRYGARRVVARDGYRSVLREFRSQTARYRKLLGRHGVRLRDPRTLPDLPAEGYRTSLSSRLAQSLEALDRATFRKREPSGPRRTSP